MQTTGLFSSSSPQQANVGGGSSLIGTLGAALVLVFGVVLLTGLSLDRTQTAMVRFLAEKGVALVTALESGVRSGTRSRTGIRLQYLVEELADRPDVRFIAVTMPDGTILAHSNPARVGEVLNTRGGRELGAETIAALRPSETPSWAIIDMEGSRAFVVFKTFHPKIKGEGRQDEPTVGPLPYVFLGLDLAPLEVAQAQNRERAVLLGAGVLLAGMLALLGLHAVERVRSSRRGQRVAEALAEELAVALPDGLVVFDAKGRVISRSVAQDESSQVFRPCVVGNAKCFGHVQCDSIIMGQAKISSVPEIAANDTEAQLIHEAAIGKIAGDQLLKLETLGLTEEEAEDRILKGFLA